jgi:hypothetical protein
MLERFGRAHGSPYASIPIEILPEVRLQPPQERIEHRARVLQLGLEVLDPAFERGRPLLVLMLLVHLDELPEDAHVILPEG